MWTTSLPRSKPGSYLPPRVEVAPIYCVSSCRVVSCFELNVAAMPRCCHQQKEDQDPVWRGGRPAEPTPVLPPRLAPHRHRGYIQQSRIQFYATATNSAVPHHICVVTQEEEPESGPTCAATPSPSRSPSPS